MSMLEQAMNQVGTPYAAQGWQCPLCKRVWSPNVQYCATHAGSTNLGSAGGVVGGGLTGMQNPYRSGKEGDLL